MEQNVIGSVPDFTPKNGESENEQVVQSTEAVTEEVIEPEKETPAESAEPASVETPSEPEQPEPADDAREKQVHGLLQERDKLLKEIQSLRGQRREIKKEEPVIVPKTADELKDVNPEDINLIDKVLRAKGYLTKEESQKMFYETVKQDELNKFLEKYPEYKPENDPHDLNWSALQRELGFYRMPDDPHLILEILNRAHRSVAKPTSDRGLPEKRQQVKTAGIGSGGTQRSSSQKSLDPDKKFLLQQGGWSEEEIQNIEQNLTD